MAIASLILGISSLSFTVFSWIAFFGGPYVAGVFVFIALATGVAGLILGCMNRDMSKGGLANTGKILSIIAVALTTINLIACIACAACLCADPYAYYDMFY